MTRMVRGSKCLRLVGSLVAVLFFAGPARAFDVTACGQTVPPGEVGMLTINLICPRLPEGNPPAVTLGDRGTLNLNGHSILAPDNTAVIAAASDMGAVRITVLGPGEILGSTIAIQGGGPMTLMNLDIHDNQTGVLNELDSRRGVVSATNVSIVNSIEDPVGHGGGVGVQTNTVIAEGITVTGSTFDGFFVRRIRGSNVTASDSGHGHPICGGLGFGIVADRVLLTHLTAQNNGSAGVIANKRLTLRDSVVTGNTGEFTCNIDVFAERRPSLRNTTCGKSNGGVRHLIRGGVPPHTVMAFSGHRTASMLKRYDIIDIDDLSPGRRAREQLPGRAGYRRGPSADRGREHRQNTGSQRPRLI